MKRIRLLFLYLTLGSLCIFFHSKEGWGGSKTPSVLKSPGDGEIPEYTLTPVLVIGEDDDPRAMLYEPNGICVDTDDNIFILDSGNKRVVKFAQDGRFLKEFGRMGQGPGEFRDPRAIDIDVQTGKLYVYDQSNMRIEIFDLNGNYLKSFNVPFLHSRLSNLSLDNSGNLVTTLVSEEGLIKIFSPELTEIATFGVRPKIAQPKGYDNDYECFVAVTPQDEFFVFFRYHPILQKYDKNYRLLFTKEIRNKDIEQLLYWRNNPDESPAKSSPGGFFSFVYCRAITSANIDGCYVAIMNKIYYLNALGDTEKILHFTENDKAENNILSDALFLKRDDYLYVVDESRAKVYKFFLIEN